MAMNALLVEDFGDAMQCDVARALQAAISMRLAGRGARENAMSREAGVEAEWKIDHARVQRQTARVTLHGRRGLDWFVSSWCTHTGLVARGCVSGRPGSAVETMD